MVVILATFFSTLPSRLREYLLNMKPKTRTGKIVRGLTIALTGFLDLVLMGMFLVAQFAALIYANLRWQAGGGFGSGYLSDILAEVDDIESFNITLES